MSAASRIVRLSAVPATEHARAVVVFGIPHLGLGDLDSGDMPTLDRLVDDGAMAAASVRTYGSRPTSVEAYSTMSAGTRVRGVATAALAFPADTPVEDSTAAEVIERRLGARPSGEIVLPDGPRAIEEAGTDVSSVPGALGTALADDGRTTAVVGNADQISPTGLPVIDRPAAIGGMRDDSSVDTGAVVRESPRARIRPRRTACAPTPAAFLAEARSGDRVGRPGRSSIPATRIGPRPTAAWPVVRRREELRRAALRATDDILRDVVDELPPGTLLLVVGMTPAHAELGAHAARGPRRGRGAGPPPLGLHEAARPGHPHRRVDHDPRRPRRARPGRHDRPALRVPRRARCRCRASSRPTRWRSDGSASTTRWRSRSSSCRPSSTSW